MTYFGSALDPPLGGFGRETTTLVRDHEYFIPTKFHQNPSSGSGGEVENVKSLRTDGRTDDDDDGRTDDGRCAITIAHSSLRLRWAKNDCLILNLSSLNYKFSLSNILHEYCLESKKSKTTASFQKAGHPRTVLASNFDLLTKIHREPPGKFSLANDIWPQNYRSW